MSTIGRSLFYLTGTEEFAEMLPEGLVVPLMQLGLIFKGQYLTEAEVGSQEQFLSAKQRLSKNPSDYLLRQVPSSDGPPFWSAIIYRQVGQTDVQRTSSWQIPARLQHSSNTVQAIRYIAETIGSADNWENDAASGHPGFFLTGTSGASALWRVSRLQADALGRQTVTLGPVRLAHGIASPQFDLVSRPLRDFLVQHFDGFQKAVSRDAHFDVIDRANSLAEGALEYCLTSVGAKVPRNLFDRLREARKLLDDRQQQARFPLKQYGYHLAHRIRLLHGRLHADQTVGKGKEVRPEVGMSTAIDVSELLVEVGLGKY